MKHNIKKLLLKWAAEKEMDSPDAKKAFCEATGISYDRIQRWWKDPFYKIPGEDLFAASAFFNCSIEDVISEDTPSVKKLTN